MANSPIPFVTKAIGDAANAPDGAIPIALYTDGDATTVITPQPAPEIDPAPTDAATVAADLQALVDALIASGTLTA